MSDDREKWEFLKRAPARDAQNDAVRRLAADLLAVAQRRPQLFVELALTLCQFGVRYQTDLSRVGAEDIAGFTDSGRRSPLEALERGRDDCDAKARLFCALCLAVGIPARMAPLWTGDRLTHVYAAVYLSGRWQPAETTLARARVGDEPFAVPKEAGGQWRRA